MKIYVAMHKLVDLKFKSKLYESLLVGSFNKNIYSIPRDDLGENISSKNENYCELTGIYWMWKNSNEEILGLCHYRRFLSKNKYSNNKKYYINEVDIENCFKKGYNIILPKKSYSIKGIIFKKSTAPSEADMVVLKSIIQQKYPEYISDLNSYLSGKSGYLCNVMITRKDIFDKYCSWLFDILFETEKKLDKKTYVNDPYRKRMFGFMSERLLNVWVMHNIKELKIKEYELINTDLKINEKIINYLKRDMKKPIIYLMLHLKCLKKRV